MKPVTSPLVEQMVDRSVAGYTWNEIGREFDMDPDEVASRVNSYLNDAASGTSTSQMRMIQLRRLEKIINALWEQVMSGDLVLEGKGAANVLTAVREITDLMDLKKDRLRDEQVRMTQAQTMLIMATLDQVRVDLLRRVQEIIRHHDGEHLTEALESSWDGMFAELASSAMEANSRATIEVGEGAGELQLKKGEQVRRGEQKGSFFA